MSEGRAQKIVNAAWSRVRLCEMIDPPYPHWIAEDDASESWCTPCGTSRVAEIIAEAPDAYLDGGYDAMLSDGTVACKRCRRTLAYTLSECGVEQELDGYLRDPLDDWNLERAYEMESLLSAIADHPDGELVCDSVDLARTAGRLARAAGRLALEQNAETGRG